MITRLPVAAAMTLRPTVLSCRSLDWSPRYDLPSLAYGRHSGYYVYWRPDSTVRHHAKERVIPLAHREFCMVAPGERHVISIAVDDQGHPVSGYVNINLPPRRTPAAGWEWQDLELDLRVELGPAGDWTWCLLDVDEFEAAPLSDAQRHLAEAEVARMQERVTASVFPFVSRDRRWLGLEPPDTLG